jgi:hypothetical protein
MAEVLKIYEALEESLGKEKAKKVTEAIAIEKLIKEQASTFKNDTERGAN